MPEEATEEIEKQELVLVTDAAGYVGLYIVQLLLKSGYQIRATVKDLSDDAEIKPLQRCTENNQAPLGIVQADLLDEECWVDIVKDCHYVIHTDCPTPTVEPTDAQEVIKPGVEGTLNILKACQKTSTIKRFVLMGNICAVQNGYPDIHNKAYSEEDWADTNCTSPSLTAFMKAKILMEKAAWDFVKDPEVKFELSTVLTSMVTGPITTGLWYGTMELPKKLLEYGTPLLPSIGLGMCDVRDAALAHVRAMELPEAAGHRHIIWSDTMWMRDMATAISKEFTPLGYKIPYLVAPKFLLYIISWFHAGVRLIYPIIGQKAIFNNDRMRNVLGITPRPPETALIEMCYTMIESDRVAKTEKYNLNKV